MVGVNAMEVISNNYQKFENYKEQMGRLNKAIKQGFYLEAVFIEYSLLEDRTESILRNAGVFNPDKHNTLAKKVRRVDELARGKKNVAHKYFSEELIKSIPLWMNERNDLVHSLLKQNTSTEELKTIAEQGREIAKTLNSKSTSYRRAMQKL